MSGKQDWDHHRLLKYTNDEPPPEWPKSVRPISMNGLNLLGIDDAGRLHWDGAMVRQRALLSPLLAAGSARW